MHTLTTALPVPNVAKIRVSRVDVDDDAGRAWVHATVTGAATSREHDRSPFNLSCKNGEVQGLRAKAAPTKFLDVLQVFTATTADPQGVTGVATIYTDLLAAWNGAGTMAARKQAVETLLSSRGVFPPGVVS